MSDDLAQWFQSSGESEGFTNAIEIPTEPVKPKVEKKYSEIISRDELLRMRETENLFSNELWRLTFDEMLQAIVKPTVKKSTVSSFLQQLYDSLSEEVDLSSVSLAKSTPLSDFPLCSGYDELKSFLSKKLRKMSNSFSFGDVNMIGSFLLKANINKPETTVDIGIDLPEEILDAFLNMGECSDSHLQLFYKIRYAYLCIVKQTLEQAFGKKAVVSWKLFRELDEMKPILSIAVCCAEFSDDDDKKIEEAEKFFVNIYPTVPESKIEMIHDLLTSYIDDEDKTFAREHADLLNGIWEDTTPMRDLNTLHGLFQESPTIVQTLTLLKVWSRLRGLLHKSDGMNGYYWSIILGHLAQRSVIESAMSPYQIFKITLKWLTSLRQDIPIVFGEQESVDDISLPYVMQMFSYGDIIVLKMDGESPFNVFHRVTEISWKELLYEADLTLQYLSEENEQRIENVQSTFTTAHNHFRKYDLHLVVENLPVSTESLYKAPRMNVYNRLAEVLFQSIGSRANSIRVIGESSDFMKSKGNIIIGIILSSEEQTTFVQGPKRTGHDVHGLEKIRIDRFLSVWKERAELVDSVFDESMIYAVEWKNFLSEEIQGKNPIHIISDILTFTLSSSFDEGVQCRISGDFLYNYYFIQKATQKELKRHYEDAVMQLHDALEGIDVNLELEQVIGISSEFRECALSPIILNAHILDDDGIDEVNNPSIISYSTNVTPLRVILDFHERSKWPLTPDAAHKLKTYIYAVYHEGLKENGIYSRLYDTHLDVFVCGVVLRVQIRLQQEINRYKTSGHIKSPYVIGLDRDVVMLPIHSSYIENFTRHYPQFNHVCRLAKKWINAHLFGLDIPEALVELLVAYSCYTSEPYRPSKSNLLCFYNFLNLLANFPWQNSPLFVNLHLDPDTGRPFLTESDKNHINQIKAEYEVTPNKSPMYVVASYAYEERNFWTKFDFPSAVVLRRMIAKSKQSIKIFDALREDDLSDGVDSKDWKLIFHTSFQVFNPEIDIKHLNDMPQCLFFEPESVEKPKRCNLVRKKNITVNSFPALDFARRLRQQFSDFAGFFLDPCNPVKIGVAINPDYLNNQSLPFVLNKLLAMRSNDSSNGIALNLEGLYERIVEMSRYNGSSAVVVDKSKEVEKKKEKPGKNSSLDAAPKKNDKGELAPKNKEDEGNKKKRKREPEGKARKKARV